MLKIQRKFVVGAFWMALAFGALGTGCGDDVAETDATPADVGQDVDSQDVGMDAADAQMDTQPDVPPDPTPGCNDGVRNNDEDDIDCGGSCRDTCYSEGSSGYGQHLVLYGGTLFHLYITRGDAGSSDRVTRLRRSTDRGVSWESSIVAVHPSLRINSLVVSGNEAQPTVRVVLSYSVGDESEGVFVVASTDGGLTFGEGQHISAETDFIDDDEEASGVFFPQAAAATPPTATPGVMAVAWYDYSPAATGRGDGTWDVFFNQSADGGVTWGESRSVHTSNRPWVDPMSVSVEGSNVWILVPLNVSAGHNLTVIRSTDGGETFADPLIAVPTASGGSSQRAPQVVRKDGVLHVVYNMNRRAGDMEIGYTRSDDDGATWTPHVRVMDEGVRFRFDSINNYAGAPQLHALEDGRLVVVWVDERLSDDTTTRWAPQYSVSSDGGLTWSADAEIREGDDERNQNAQSVVYEEGGSAELVVIYSARTPSVANTSRLVRTSVSLD